MPTLTIGGKPVPKPQASATTAPRRARPDTFTVPPDPDVYRDPFTVDDSLTVEQRASWLIDAAIQLEQGLEEVAALARRIAKIGDKLNDPAHAHVTGKARREAVQALTAMEHELAGYIEAVCYDEAHADRYWQSLTPYDRESHGVPYWWRSSTYRDRLIGQAWRGLASQFDWPLGWRLPADVLDGLPWVMVCDLNAAKIREWVPNPRPAMFDGPATETPIPHEIGTMLIDERGNRDDLAE